MIWGVLPLVWGSTFLGTKICLREFPPLWMAALRYALTSLICLPLWWRLVELPQKRRVLRSARLYLMVTLSGVFFAALFQNIGLQYTTATVAALISILEPVLVAVFCVVFLRERLKCRAVCGLALALLGGWVLATNGQLPSKELLDGGVKGNLFVVLSLVSYAAYTIFSKRLLESDSPLSAVTISSFLGMIMLALVAWIFEPMPAWSRISSGAWLALIYMGVFPTALAYGLYNWLLQRVAASRMTVVLFLIPIYGAILGVLILKEPLSAATGWGALLTFIGVGIFEYFAARRAAA